MSQKLVRFVIQWVEYYKVLGSICGTSWLKPCVKHMFDLYFSEYYNTKNWEVFVELVDWKPCVKHMFDLYFSEWYNTV